MPANQGVICTADQLFNFLKIMGCDREEDEFCVSGDIVSFMGMGSEYVIGEDAHYYVGGKPVPLAHTYASVTGRGRATVII